MILIQHVKKNLFARLIAFFIPELQKAYPDIEFENKIIAKHNYEHIWADGTTTELNRCAIFLNIENGKYFILDPNDYADHITKYWPAIENDKNFVHLYKMQYNEALAPNHPWITPMTYLPRLPGQYEQIRSEILSIKDKRINFGFIGRRWHGRQRFLKKLKDIINIQNGLDLKEYMKTLRSMKITLSLPGKGNLCHREIEAFGLGIPVIMPELQNRHANKLVPDEHYIACDPTPEGIRIAYERYINDDKALEDFAQKGLEWYLKNGTLKAFAHHMSEGMRKILDPS